MLSEDFAYWFSSVASCCFSREKPRASESSLVPVPGRGLDSAGFKKNMVVRDQPAAIPRPSAEPRWSSERTYEKTPARGREKARLADSARTKRWFSRSSSPTRRLQISAPTDFRHLHDESFQFPPPAPRPRPRSFRPIELSIYQPHNRLSPILPHLDDDFITPPPRAYTASSSRWDGSSGTTLAHERNLPGLSFHLPRRHVPQGSGISDASMTPPPIPPKSRARAYTAPATGRILERIASAMIERERLQAEIDSVMERQSIYASSRPSTDYDMQDLEPMPSIPALPAAAPSFAERVSVDGRPRTAPTRMSHMTAQERALEFTAAAQSHPPFGVAPHGGASSETDLGRPLAPPLPLILRPPLRKKKSFSRVSNWLFHPDEARSSATSTVVPTTSPRPVTASDGFYQCVAPPEGLPRTSMDTSSSVYTWETGEREEDEDETKTQPTTAPAWSPEQTPRQVSSGATPVAGTAALEKEVVGLGVAGSGHRPLSVGVAF